MQPLSLVPRVAVLDKFHCGPKVRLTCEVLDLTPQNIQGVMFSTPI